VDPPGPGDRLGGSQAGRRDHSRVVARGDVIWADLGGSAGTRPVCILTRGAAIAGSTSPTCAPITRTIRGIRSEVEVGPAEGSRPRASSRATTSSPFRRTTWSANHSGTSTVNAERPSTPHCDTPSTFATDQIAVGEATICPLMLGLLGRRRQRARRRRRRPTRDGSGERLPRAVVPRRGVRRCAGSRLRIGPPSYPARRDSARLHRHRGPDRPGRRSRRQGPDLRRAGVSGAGASLLRALPSG